jgi:hypothetical protein
VRRSTLLINSCTIINEIINAIIIAQIGPRSLVLLMPERKRAQASFVLGSFEWGSGDLGSKQYITYFNNNLIMLW